MIGWEQGEDEDKLDEPMSLEDFNEKFGTDWSAQSLAEAGVKNADKVSLSQGDNTNVDDGAKNTNAPDKNAPDPTNKSKNANEANSAGSQHAQGESPTKNPNDTSNYIQIDVQQAPPESELGEAVEIIRKYAGKRCKFEQSNRSNALPLSTGCACESTLIIANV